MKYSFNCFSNHATKHIEGLKDITKSGILPNLSDGISFRIKKELKESKHGWSTEQVEELIVKKSGVKYHYTYIYRILRKWGFKQKVPRKVHVNTVSREEKDDFKKRLHNRYLWINTSIHKTDLW
jgi:putative transposase